MRFYTVTGAKHITVTQTRVHPQSWKLLLKYEHKHHHVKIQVKVLHLNLSSFFFSKYFFGLYDFVFTGRLRGVTGRRHAAKGHTSDSNPAGPLQRGQDVRSIRSKLYFCCKYFCTSAAFTEQRPVWVI